MLTKHFIKIGLMIAALGLLVGCSSSSSSAGSGKVKVVASFYPVANFARQVAGGRAEVKSVIPDGQDPHEYDPTSRDLAAAYDSRLFIYNGANLEPWAEKIRPELESKGIKVLRLSDSVDLLTGISGEVTQDVNKADPHIWLDPVSAQKMVGLIRDALVALDPAGAADYQSNASAYLTKLQALDQEFEKGLSDCKSHTVVLSHMAFQYLAKRYGFKAIGISGLSPEEEPSPKDYARLVDDTKNMGIHYIFFEIRSNPKLAESLASEIGGETLNMYHLDGGFTPEESANPNLYVEQMRANLDNLRKAMECR
jgi:zinc transport system substrate-binding protein